MTSTNSLSYSFFVLPPNKVNLTNNEVLFQVVVDGVANCCFIPRVSIASFVSELGVPTIIAERCDGEEFCFPSVTIRGTIETVTGGTEAVGNVEMIITDELGNQHCPGLLTGPDGQYTCDVIPDLNYTVRPLRNDQHCLGVTSADLNDLSNALIQLGTPLDPFQQISADVNNDDQLDVFDLFEMQKIIICLEEEFPNNTSWRFVDATYDWFNSLTQPVAQDFAEEVLLTPNDLILNSFYIADFQAMKIGDINGSCPGPSCMSCCGSEPPGEDPREIGEDLSFEQTRRLMDDFEILVQSDLREEQLTALRSGYLVSKIYPNPFEEQIGLEVFSMFQSEASLRLFDGMGRVVTQQELSLEEGFNNFELTDLDNLPTGIYYTQIQVGHHTMVNKVIKF